MLSDDPLGFLALYCLFACFFFNKLRKTSENTDFIALRREPVVGVQNMYTRSAECSKAGYSMFYGRWFFFFFSIVIFRIKTCKNRSRHAGEKKKTV